MQLIGSEAERRDGATSFANNPASRPYQENRNRRSVWTVPTMPYKGAHFATFPPDLIEPCILAGCPADGVCLDPFCGAGTTPLVCMQQHVRCVGIELNPNYCDLIARRLEQGVLPFGKSA